MDEGTNDVGPDYVQGEPAEPYGFMEREVAFKLLASHAMVDPGFYSELRADPRRAAGQLHILLTDQDVDYIKNKVEWGRIDRHADEVRDALNLELVTHSW
jgi:hypothetical protein